MENNKEWVIHYVIDDKNDSLVDIHTHGLRNFEKGLLGVNLPEFQIVIPLSEDLAEVLLNDLCTRVKNGKTFCDGEIIDNLIENYTVKLHKVNIDGLDVFRIIFPDSNGAFPWWENCDPMFKLQIEGE